MISGISQTVVFDTARQPSAAATLSVSTADQTLALQKDALEKAGCERIFTDPPPSRSTIPRRFTNSRVSRSRGGLDIAATSGTGPEARCRQDHPAPQASQPSFADLGLSSSRTREPRSRSPAEGDPGRAGQRSGHPGRSGFCRTRGTLRRQDLRARRVEPSRQAARRRAIYQARSTVMEKGG